ncbi:hypothetical protein CMV37_11285 [Bacillus cereus]|nr:hypothetical protein CMV37_11285 [Bacillus cereus]
MPVIIFLVTMPLINKAMHPDEKHTITVDPSVFHEEAAAQEVGNNTFAEKMENSIIITLCVGLLGLIYIFNYFYTKGFNLTLDIVIFYVINCWTYFPPYSDSIYSCFFRFYKKCFWYFTSVSILCRNYGHDDWSK